MLNAYGYLYMQFIEKNEKDDLLLTNVSVDAPLLTRGYQYPGMVRYHNQGYILLVCTLKKG